MLCVIPVYIEVCAFTQTNLFVLNMFSMKNSHVICRLLRGMPQQFSTYAAWNKQSGMVITSSMSQLLPNELPLVLVNYSWNENIVPKASLEKG